jgi:chromosomal replication initiation ATPase DnaA
VAAAADHFGCAADEWSSGRRSDAIGRAVAAFLARRRFGYPMGAIAEALGYRRHSSVGTAVSRVEAAGGSICEALASLQEQLANV